MDKKRFEEAAFKMSYEEYLACNCIDCDNENCKHRNAYRRFPEIDGGLGLCPNLIKYKKNQYKR